MDEPGLSLCKGKRGNWLPTTQHLIWITQHIEHAIGDVPDIFCTFCVNWSY